MNNSLKNQNIIVTAAGQGIGKATAIALHNEGANVIATAINEKTLKTLNEEFPQIKVYSIDSTDTNAIQTFVHTHEKLDAFFISFNCWLVLLITCRI